MKVTPIDIRHKEFRRAMRGYSEEEVDLFLDEVADDFEVLFKENIELQDEIHRLKEQVAQYDNLKETLQKTLISAQQQSDETRANARKEAELILRDAELQSRNIISESYTEKQKVQQSVVQLRQAEDDFRFKFRSLLEAHLNLLMEDEASEDRKRFRDVANGTAEQPAQDDTSSQEATVLIAPQQGAAGRSAVPEALPSEEVAAAAPPASETRPVTPEASPAAVETSQAPMATPAAVPTASAVSPVEETPEIDEVVATAAERLRPEPSGAGAGPGQEVPSTSLQEAQTTLVREAGEGPPSWLTSVSGSSMTQAEQPVVRVPRQAARPSAADVAQTAGGAQAASGGVPVPADTAVRKGPVSLQGDVADQDASAFDDFDDFDFGLPEDPDSGLENLAGDKKTPRKESPVRRFLFGSRNASRSGRDQDDRDDRDFDW